MIYLASPYSSSDPLIVKTRYLIAKQVTEALMTRGIHIFSPIVHCHELTIPQSDGSFAFWQRYNFDMLRRSDAMLVLAISGWKKSIGVQAEIEFARLAGILISAVDEDGVHISWPE